MRIWQHSKGAVADGTFTVRLSQKELSMIGEALGFAENEYAGGSTQVDLVWQLKCQEISKQFCDLKREFGKCLK